MVVLVANMYRIVEQALYIIIYYVTEATKVQEETEDIDH